MKRTRRVEVIRYSRRSTLIGNDVTLEPDLTTEQTAIDALLEVPYTIESPVEEIGDEEQQLSGAGDPAVVPKRRQLGLFKNWIRKRNASIND